MTSRPSPFGPLDRLVERAGTLAGSWGARARASTTVGQERAILRLFGVAGLDAAGQPLAGAAVERWLRTSRGGLGGGIALPFAMGLIEYDLEPQRLALDVASGAVDLALEAELLHEADRRSLAETEARRLASLAVERIDADRTARRELQGLLGEARRPWLGTTLIEPDLDEARDEVVRLATAGFDLLRVEVPMGRELADRLLDAGMEAPQWQPRDRPRPAVVGESEDNEPAPTGSQRALSRLRAIADRIAAERLGYVRLATSIPPLGVPEGAVVAAFERVDLVEADPIAEIVAGGVDPDRALSDHAFARRLHRRADTLIGIGPGPLVVAPDMAAGVPSLPATRSGRALACQLIGVALSLGDGVPADRIVIGACPAWLADEPAASARILAEVAIRRALFPDHLLRFDEPALANTAAADGWPFIVSAVLARSGPAAMVMRRASADPGRAAAVARASALVAAEVLTVAPPGALEGAAQIHAAATLAAALDTLESLAERGWRAIVGEPGRGSAGAIGGDAVAERTETFDPLEAFSSSIRRPG